jgi:hypothetical protein
MHDYIIERIERSFRVECGEENCFAVLSVKSVLFMSLPGEVQAKYGRVHKSLFGGCRKLYVSQEDTHQNAHCFSGKS